MAIIVNLIGIKVGHLLTANPSRILWESKESIGKSTKDPENSTEIPKIPKNPSEIQQESKESIGNPKNIRKNP